jgi:transposase
MRVRRSRLTDEQTGRLLEHFVAGTPARMAAELVQVNRNTATLFYHRMRLLIAERLSSESPPPVALGEEALEPTPAPPGKGEHHPKMPAFALVRRGDKVFTVMLPGSARAQAGEGPLRLDSALQADAGRAPSHVTEPHPERVQRRARLARGRSPISSAENFWGQAKRQLRRYNGVPRQHFHLFLKECEWRYNYGPPKHLLKLLKSWLRRKPRTRSSMPGRG